MKKSLTLSLFVHVLLLMIAISLLYVSKHFQNSVDVGAQIHSQILIETDLSPILANTTQNQKAQPQNGALQEVTKKLSQEVESYFLEIRSEIQKRRVHLRARATIPR